MSLRTAGLSGKPGHRGVEVWTLPTCPSVVLGLGLAAGVTVVPSLAKRSRIPYHPVAGPWVCFGMKAGVGEGPQAVLTAEGQGEDLSD